MAGAQSLPFPGSQRDNDFHQLVNLFLHGCRALQTFFKGGWQPGFAFVDAKAVTEAFKFPCLHEDDVLLGKAFD